MFFDFPLKFLEIFKFLNLGEYKQWIHALVKIKEGENLKIGALQKLLIALVFEIHMTSLQQFLGITDMSYSLYIELLQKPHKYCFSELAQGA